MSDHAATLVHQLKQDLVDQPKNPVRPYQVEENYSEELDRLQSMTSAPPWVQTGNRAAISKRIRQKRENLERQLAKPIPDGVKRDRVQKLAQELLDSVIRPAMLPQEVMRRNPAGAVDAYRSREASRFVKDAILTWKRAQVVLHADEKDNRGVANLEPYRPSLSPSGMSSFMAEAQIPGVFAMSPQAKANWPLPEPKHTPIRQAQQREKKKSRTWTPAQRQAMAERCRLMRVAKAAKQHSADV